MRLPDFAKPTDRLDRFLTWYGGYGLVSAVLSSLAKHLKFLQPYGWPEAIFIGLGVTALLALVLSISLLAWRAFRPISKPSVADLKDEEETVESSEIERIADVVSEDNYKLSKAEENVSFLLEQVGGALARLEAIDSRISALESRVTAQFESAAADAQTSIRQVGSSLSAIFDRERLIAMTDLIDNQAHDLSKPTRGEPIADFTKWERGQSDWRYRVGEWVMLVSHYQPGIREKIFVTPEEMYRGTWSFRDDAFPNADAVYAYKTFRIILANYERARSTAMSAVTRAAFHSLPGS